ncbi:DUF4157 domain-containing protein [Deinococcus sp. HMF7620]|uniref:DUF4157 domain-containing protein n=1 Tax=Deinococcus arboris TaxID=2682977 RepID=A0A7C9LPT2_9DEIO|nr:DUF4157 domain-containing protein [Deinococcus arboris]MVN88036.1 DUF4157 domain-containing protein [Deinococcus arboris]
MKERFPQVKPSRPQTTRVAPEVESTFSSPSPESQQERQFRRWVSRPSQLQRQVAQPVLRAATLIRQEEERLSTSQQAVQRQLKETQVSEMASSARPLQAQRAATTQPTTPAEWVTVMRTRAEDIEGRALDARGRSQFTALQRQVAQTLAQGFRMDQGPAHSRYESYGEHLATLQRHPMSAPVSRVVMGLVPASERLALQRAVDTAAQRQHEQAAQQTQQTQVAAFQRQLAELNAEATQPVLQRIQARRGSGHPLPEAIQRHLEQGLNQDLSRVRIHDDAEANLLAKGVNATAFTTGNDIFFQSGRFSPNTQSGLELLAHEVTHTVQQAQGRVGPGIDPDAGLETEASIMGARLAAAPLTQRLKTKATASAPFSAALQRQAAVNGTSWRESGKLKGNPPVRDETSPPNSNIVEDEQRYRTLRAGAQKLLQGQRQRAQALLTPDKKGVRDYRFWFAHVYSYVTANEIEFCEQRTFDYPSYVLQCVLYFDKLYADNLSAIKGQVEPHWKAAFATSARMQNGDYLPTQVGAAVWSLVASMLAHIRFDLPRAEAWVAQGYQKAYGAKPADFRSDFFRMSGVFDNASRSMFKDIERLLPDKLNAGPTAVRKM